MPDGQVLELAGSPNVSARSPPSTISRPGSNPDRSRASSVPTAPARPPRCACCWASSAPRRARDDRRQALQRAHLSAADGGRGPRGLELPPRTLGREPPQGLRARGGPADLPRRRGPRPGRARRCRRSTGRRLLARHAPASRTRHGAPRRPGCRRARRALERPRSRGHPVDALAPAAPRRRGSHGPHLVAPPRRGAADGRRAADHLARPPGVPGRHRRPRRPPTNTPPWSTRPIARACRACSTSAASSTSCSVTASRSVTTIPSRSAASPRVRGSPCRTCRARARASRTSSSNWSAGCACTRARCGRPVRARPDAETPPSTTNLDAFPAPTGAPAPAVSHDALSSDAPGPDEARPSTALVAVMTPPRAVRTAPRPPRRVRGSRTPSRRPGIDIVSPAGHDDRAADRPADQPLDQEVPR